MRYLVVVIASLGVGAVVYVLSMRAGEPEPAALGFEPAIVPLEEPVAAAMAVEEDTTLAGATAAGVAAPAPGYTYLQVEVRKGPSPRERIQGLVGSMALVAVAAIALAGGIYTIGAVIGRLVRTFLGEGEP